LGGFVAFCLAVVLRLIILVATLAWAALLELVALDRG
jgi:hypothetical protein